MGQVIAPNSVSSDSVSTDSVSTSVVDGLLTVRLSRPRAHNALDRSTKTALRVAVKSASTDDSVRALLLIADGKNFCVGQDLGEHVEALKESPATAMDTVADDYNPLIRAFAALDVPVVVAIQGACVGAGFGIALAGDIRVAGESSSFATAFTGIGLAADSGLSYQLVRNLGASRATGLLMLGDRISAAQALDAGLVYRVVPDDELRSTATELAQKLAAGPTAAFREIKRLVHAPDAGLDAALDREAAVQRALGQTADHRAAVEAFLAKSTPTFTGH